MNTSTSCLSQHTRRGLSMMLVLIALAMATIVTTAYLAARDNSTQVGANVVDASIARAAAATGVDIGVAIMQTETDWRTSHAAGTLVDDYAFEDASITIELTDVLTGLPPDETSQFIEMTVRAVVNGIEQTNTAYCEVIEVAGDPVVDVDLSEFSVFATNMIEMTDSATIMRWPEAPASDLGKRVSIGTTATAASSVQIKNSAAAIDTTIYSGPSASPSLVLNQGGSTLEEVQLSDPVPVPLPPEPGVRYPEADDAFPYLWLKYSTTGTSGEHRLASIEMPLQGGLYLNNATITANHGVYMYGESFIDVWGDCKLIVYDDMVLDHSRIVINDGASLEIYISGNLELNESYIGDAPYNVAKHDFTGSANYMDPGRIAIYSIAQHVVTGQAPTIGAPAPVGKGAMEAEAKGAEPVSYDWDAIDVPEGYTLYKEADGQYEMRGPGTDLWSLDDMSVVKASIYAPYTVGLLLEDNSALYGRVLAQRVAVTQNCAIFYDHALDDGTGYTNEFSALFDGEGNIKDSFKGLVSLDASVLEALAASDSIVVRSGKEAYGVSESEPVVVPTPGVPTDRPIPVDYTILVYTSDVTEWEAAAAK